MSNTRRSDLRVALEGFASPRDGRALAVLVLDWALYLALVAAAVLVASPWIKVLAAVCAGTAISRLFILGHDAGHRALVSSRLGNSLIERLVFLPCLHNASLWEMQHNRAHHQDTNVRGRNSYSPMSPREYAQGSTLRRWLERFYRSPCGFGAYYFVERWLKHKLLPTKGAPVRSRSLAWLDFGLLVLWLGTLCGMIVSIDALWGVGNPVGAVLWGFVVPFLAWNQLMGTTAFLQHTHPAAHWSFEHDAERADADVTVLVRFPRWYDVLSHNIMQHPAHHANPRIPWYRLYTAQQWMSEVANAEMICERMTPMYLFRVCRDCQVYDYDRKAWMRFSECCSRAPQSTTTQGDLLFSRNGQVEGADATEAA